MWENATIDFKCILDQNYIDKSIHQFDFDKQFKKLRWQQQDEIEFWEKALPGDRLESFCSNNEGLWNTGGNRIVRNGKVITYRFTWCS